MAICTHCCAILPRSGHFESRPKPSANPRGPPPQTPGGTHGGSTPKAAYHPPPHAIPPPPLRDGAAAALAAQHYEAAVARVKVERTHRLHRAEVDVHHGPAPAPAPGLPMVGLSAKENCPVLPGITWHYPVLPGITRCYPTLPGITRHYPVLPGGMEFWYQKRLGHDVEKLPSPAPMLLCLPSLC